MPPWLIVLLIVLAVLLGALITLSIIGRKMQRKQDASQEQIRATAQTVSILVIDKKRMKIKEAGFPQIVLDQTPKYLRRAKVPVIKAKIGPKVMSLMCEEKIFDVIPKMKEVKVLMNGIYIIEVKGARGGLEAKPLKQSFFKRLRSKAMTKLDSREKTGKKK